MAKEVGGAPAWKVYGVAVLFTLSIGFSFFGIKKCVPYADTLTILAYRYLAALIGVLVWILIAKAMGMMPQRKPGRPKGKLYMNALFYLLFMIFQILAMFFATSIEGAIVFSMVPIFSKILGRIVLGEKSTRMQMFFTIMTVSALVILIILNATNVEMNITGLIIMTISSIFMACQNVSARYIRGVFQPMEITTAISVGGSVVFIGALIVRGFIRGSFEFLIEPLHHPDFIIWVSFLGIFCILLSAQFMVYMLAHMEIIQASVFNNASTLISIVAGALILGETLMWYHYLCGVIIIAGVVGMVFAPSKAENAGRALDDDLHDKN